MGYSRRLVNSPAGSTDDGLFVRSLLKRGCADLEESCRTAGTSVVLHLVDGVHDVGSVVFVHRLETASGLDAGDVASQALRLCCGRESDSPVCSGSGQFRFSVRAWPV